MGRDTFLQCLNNAHGAHYTKSHFSFLVRLIISAFLIGKLTNGNVVKYFYFPMPIQFAIQKRPIRIAFTDEVTRDYDILWETLHQMYSVTIDPQNPDIVFYGEGKHQDHRRYSCKKVYVAVENLWPDFSYCDYAFTFIQIRNPRNFRMP